MNDTRQQPPDDSSPESTDIPSAVAAGAAEPSDAPDVDGAPKAAETAAHATTSTATAESKPASSLNLAMSEAPEAGARELSEGMTTREKVYYAGVTIVLLAIVAIALWYLDPFDGNRGKSRPGGERVDSSGSADLAPRERKLEALNLTPLSGGEERLKLSDLRGNVVLINFWGPWCDPCREEFPDIYALEREYRDSDKVRIVALSVPATNQSIQDARTATQAFLDQNGYEEGLVYMDPDKITTRTAHLAGLLRNEVPVTVLLDGNHFIRRHWVGRQTRHEFESAITALLREEE